MSSFIFVYLVPPMLSIPNQLEGAFIGQDVFLECHTEAYPQSINYWTMEGGEMIISGMLLFFKQYIFIYSIKTNNHLYDM